MCHHWQNSNNNIYSCRHIISQLSITVDYMRLTWYCSFDCYWRHRKKKKNRCINTFNCHYRLKWISIIFLRIRVCVYQWVIICTDSGEIWEDYLFDYLIHLVSSRFALQFHLTITWIDRINWSLIYIYLRNV